jgi:hypothetical protein
MTGPQQENKCGARQTRRLPPLDTARTAALGQWEGQAPVAEAESRGDHAALGSQGPAPLLRFTTLGGGASGPRPTALARASFRASAGVCASAIRRTAARRNTAASPVPAERRHGEREGDPLGSTSLGAKTKSRGQGCRLEIWTKRGGRVVAERPLRPLDDTVQAQPSTGTALAHADRGPARPPQSVYRTRVALAACRTMWRMCHRFRLRALEQFERILRRGFANLEGPAH